jgi:hypothetical protein
MMMMMMMRMVVLFQSFGGGVENDPSRLFHVSYFQLFGPGAGSCSFYFRAYCHRSCRVRVEPFQRAQGGIELDPDFSSRGTTTFFRGPLKEH